MFSKKSVKVSMAQMLADLSTSVIQKQDARLIQQFLQEITQNELSYCMRAAQMGMRAHEFTQQTFIPAKLQALREDIAKAVMAEFGFGFDASAGSSLVALTW